ncbi:MAG: FKBP-type peptidyl-prolyl cis-trans isomerase, partial [Bacteroidales bacterium]
MITKNKVVSITYTLHYDDKDGEIVEKVESNAPMTILMGHGLLLDRFEEQLEGLNKGDTFAFSLTSEEAYGEYDEDGLVNVPLAELMDGVPAEENDMLFEGNIIPIQDHDGEEYQAVILEIKNDIVSLDFNHPLAGENLYFEGNIVNIRDAKP